MSKVKKLSLVHNTENCTDEHTASDCNKSCTTHTNGQILPAEAKLIERLTEENHSLRKDLDRLLKQAGQALLKTLELKDPYTYGHSMRVMEYTLLIGRAASLSLKDMHNLEVAAMFHDVGKVGTPDCVLLKPARLTPEEQLIMAKHAQHSGDIIELIDELKPAGAGVRSHHERFDGHGYPKGLKGKDIPFPSRIILVADTFDAMTSTRPYRKALPTEVAYAELEKFSGIQFDPDFVKIFLREHQKLTQSAKSLPKAIIKQKDLRKKNAA